MRIVGVNIPDNKIIEVSLTYIYGIGRPASRKILSEAKVDPQKKTAALTSDEMNRIHGIVEKKWVIEGDLRQFIKRNIQRLKDLKTYRGIRHLRRLPAHFKKGRFLRVRPR